MKYRAGNLNAADKAIGVTTGFIVPIAMIGLATGGLGLLLLPLAALAYKKANAEPKKEEVV